MKRGTISKLLATSALAFAASASQAAVVNSWDIVLDMQWNTNPGSTDFSAGMSGYTPGSQYVSATEISWGAANGSFLDSNPDRARSGLLITRPHVTGSVTTSFEGQEVYTTSANMFTHLNSAIAGNFKTLERATLDLTVQLLLPGTGDMVVNLAKSFDVHFYETPNVPGQCTWGLCEDDVFAVIAGIDLTSTFTYGGQQYTLNYFETTGHITELSNAACNTMGFAGGSCYGFTTPENNRTDVMFNLSITTAVPEPETYAMLLAGLGMIGVVARRRRNAIRR